MTTLCRRADSQPIPTIHDVFPSICTCLSQLTQLGLHTKHRAMIASVHLLCQRDAATMCHSMRAAPICTAWEHEQQTCENDNQRQHVPLMAGR